MADADFTFNPNIAITPDHQIDLSGTVDPGVRNLQIFDQSGGVLNLTVKPDGTWSGSESYNPNVSTAYSYKAEYNDASGQAQTTLDPTGVTVGLPFTFNPDITFTPDNKMVLTGTVDPGVRNLQIHDENGGVPDITIKPDGTWSATYALEPNTATQYSFTASYNDASGKAQTTLDQTIASTGIQGNPFSTITDYFGDSKGVVSKFYSSNGDLEYHSTLTSTDFNETGDQVRTSFVFVNDASVQNIVQDITNFHAVGSNHDTLLLPHADFANMADLLRNTTMSGGNAVIHDPNNSATMTLTGVTKHEMQLHQSDFSFHGSGRFGNAS